MMTGKDADNVLYVKMFGEFSVTWNGKRITGGSGAGDTQFGTLLQYLIHNRDRKTDRSALEELLFAGREIQDRWHAMRSIVYNARKRLRAACLPEAEYIRRQGSVYVWTEVWQHLGWDSILYIAALAAIDPSLYEAATMDGASKWQKMLKIDIPLLMPTATVMFILRMGSVMNVGFEKVYLLQNNLNTASSEIISTYVYKMGLVSSQYSLSSAIGLFNNLINLVLLVTVNYISKKMSDTSLV